MISEKGRQLLKYTGNPDQIFYAQPMTLRDGREDGIHVIDVDNGSGLHFWIMPGNCLDIGRLSLHGVNLSFLSKAGFTHAAYFEPEGMRGIHTFSPGFLRTCGLRNSGLPCEVGGEEFGFHGRIGQTPASMISIQRHLDAETPDIQISGRTREGWLFGPNLELFRTITVFLRENRIEIQDQITNLAAAPEEIMMLYHFNLGYPFLTEHAHFITSHQYEKPVDEHAAALENLRYQFKAPVPEMPENCFYYRQQRDEQGRSFAACVSDDTGLGVMIATSPEELPLLCNWQSWASGDYVMGIEPCTCYGDGRAAHLERDQMIRLEPFETRNHHVTVRFLEQDECIRLKESRR